MVEFCLSGEARVGLFAVWKKEGRQRLIADARLSNVLFTPCAPVELATGQALGAIESEGPV
eukprot:3518802-Lingulodinium_polyedra.AAC.1